MFDINMSRFITTLKKFLLVKDEFKYFILLKRKIFMFYLAKHVSDNNAEY